LISRIFYSGTARHRPAFNVPNRAKQAYAG